MFVNFTRKEFIQALLTGTFMAALGYFFILAALLVFQGFHLALH